MYSYQYILHLFISVFCKYIAILDDKRSINKKITTRGRARFVTPVDCLALVLGWSCTWCSLIVLQLLFGTTIALVSKHFQLRRRILLNILKTNNLAMISLSTQEKSEESRDITQAWHLVLNNVWGRMDGLKYCSEKALDEIVQSRFFNEWKSDDYMIGHFVFCT